MERPHQSLESPLTRPHASHSRASSYFHGGMIEGADWDRERLRERALEIDKADSQFRLTVADVFGAPVRISSRRSR